VTAAAKEETAGEATFEAPLAPLVAATRTAAGSVAAALMAVGMDSVAAVRGEEAAH